MIRLPYLIRLSVGAVLLAALALSVAVAQQPRQTATTTLLYYGMLYLSDPALHKELKLSDDQVKKVTEHRDKWMAQIQQSSPQSKDREEATKASDKALAEILDAAQVKRLKQITLQQLESGRSIRSTSLSRLPEVIEELKLTDDQKSKLGFVESLTEALTDDQKTKWKAMKGDKFDVALQPAFPGGGFPGGFGPRVTMPARLQYLLQKSVQDELALTEKQEKTVAELQQKWQDLFPIQPGRPTVDQRKAERTSKDIETAIGEMLQPAQMKRLRQIELQAQVGRRRGTESTVLTLPAVVRDLKLTDAQQEKISSIQEERGKEIVPLFLTGETYAEIAKKVEAYKKETSDKLHKVLTEDQQAQLKEMIGKPFTGEISPAGFPGPSGRPSALNTPMYLSISGLTFTEATALHDELKLTEDQVKKLAALREKSRTESLRITTDTRDTAQRDKKRKELAASNDKALADILEPEQLARFKQIALQQYERSRATFTSPLARFVEVADELKLSEDQKRRLSRGETMAAVLDEKQAAKWKEMLGKPFATNLSPVRPEGFPGRGPVLPVVVRYLQEKSVQEELKLTEAQIKKVADLDTKWQEATKDFPNWSVDDRGKNLAEAREKLDGALAELLDKVQGPRLRQIELQQVEKQGLGVLLANTQVVKGLELKEEQQEKVKTINADFDNISGLMFREIPRTRTASDEWTKASEALQLITRTKLTDVLTEKQRARLKELLGEPFKGELRRGFPGGFPGGGFGGFPLDG